MEHVYAHLSKVLTKVGEQVSVGQKVGEIGSTGVSTGAHLHYEVRKNGYGTDVDPTKYLNGSSYSTSASDASRIEAERLQAVDQAKSDLLGLKQESANIADQIQELYYEIVQSHIASYDRAISNLSDDYAKVDLLQSREMDTSKKWVDYQLKREKLMNKELDYTQESINFIQDQIKHNKNLSAAQKDLLSDEVVSRTQQLYQLEQDILNERISMAEKIIDTYKQALEAQKQVALDAVDDLLKEIDDEVAESDYLKRLQDAEKSRQEIMDEIAELSLDNSDSAKKRLDELNKQLEQSNIDIDEIQEDRATELRREELNEKRTEIEDNYDNLLNDERAFANMRSNIIKANTNQIEKDLSKYYSNVKANTKVLGKALSNNLIDLINQANRYMNGKDFKPVNIASLDKGGITPKWGSSGKLAMLHEEEMVSNKFDTRNLLKAFDVSKNIINMIKPMNLGNLSPNIAASGGVTNNFSIALNVDNLNGTKSDANFLLTEVVKGVEKLGGKFTR